MGLKGTKYNGNGRCDEKKYLMIIIAIWSYVSNVGIIR